MFDSFSCKQYSLKKVRLERLKVKKEKVRVQIIPYLKKLSNNYLR